MSLDLYVTSKSKPSFALVEAAAAAQGYQLEEDDPHVDRDSGPVSERNSWAWRGPERSRIATMVDPVGDESYELEPDETAPGAEWILWLSFSSHPRRNTIVEAYRLAQVVARRLDGVIFDPVGGEIIPLDEQFDDFRPGLRGVLDDLREMMRVHSAVKAEQRPGDSGSSLDL